MGETLQAAVAAPLQHPVVAVATTPMQLGPLRLDSIDPPSSGKMVSLADLHVNTKTPATTPANHDTQVRKFPCPILV